MDGVKSPVAGLNDDSTVGQTSSPELDGGVSSSHLQQRKSDLHTSRSKKKPGRPSNTDSKQRSQSDSRNKDRATGQWNFNQKKPTRRWSEYVLDDREEWERALDQKTQGSDGLKLPVIPRRRTLMELAKDSSTTVEDFMEAARLKPQELTITESLEESMPVEDEENELVGEFTPVGVPRTLPDLKLSGLTGSLDAGHHSSRGRRGVDHVIATGVSKARALVKRSSMPMSMAPNATFDSSMPDQEHGLTPLHYFFGRAKLENYHRPLFTIILELHELDEHCIRRTTSFLRTPVHYLMEYNRVAPRDLLWSLRSADKQAYLRLDVRSFTPLDCYFKHNPAAVAMDVTVDPVVRDLCSAAGSWGLR